MSHSYYKNPRGRMIKMAILFGSLCVSAYTLPKTIDKLGGSGLSSLIQPGGGLSPETQRLLGEGGLDAALRAERESTKQSGGSAVIITPSGTMTDAEYQRLQLSAARQAPIKVIKGKRQSDDQALTKEQLEEEEQLNHLLSLLEEQTKGG